MAKKEPFPPLWATYSRCQEFWFGWRLVEHILSAITAAYLGRLTLALSERQAPGSSAGLYGPLLAFGATTALVWLLLYLPSVIYTRLWISEEGLAWRSLFGKGVMQWSQVTGWTEEWMPLAPNLRVRSGVLILPIAHLKGPGEIRKTLRARGVPNHEIFPQKIPLLTEKFPGRDLLYWCITLGFASELARRDPPLSQTEFVLNSVGVILGIIWIFFWAWHRLQRTTVHEDKVVNIGPIPGKSCTLQLHSLSRVKVACDSQALPQSLTLIEASESSKERHAHIPGETPNFAGLLTHLAALRPDLFAPPETTEPDLDALWGDMVTKDG